MISETLSYAMIWSIMWQFHAISPRKTGVYQFPIPLVMLSTYTPIETIFPYRRKLP